MNKNIKKRFISLLLFTIMLFSSFMPLIEVKAMANTNNEENQQEIKDEVIEVDNLENKNNQEVPVIPDVGGEMLTITLKAQLLGTIGRQEDLPAEKTKDYIKAVPEGSVMIKDFLDLGEMYKSITDKVGFDYSPEYIMVGSLKIEAADYESKKLEDIITTGDYNILDGVDTITVYYKGEVKPIVKNVNLKLNIIDEIHSTGDRVETKTMAVKYLGLPEPTITVTGIKVDDTKVKFIASGGIETVELEYSIQGYEIKEIQQKPGDGNEFDIKVSPKEIVDPEVIIAKPIFENLHNNEKFVGEIKKNMTDGKYYSKNGTDITDLINVEILNRKNNDADLLKKYYYNDSLKISVVEGKENEFVEKMIGSKFQKDIDGKMEITTEKIQAVSEKDISNNKFDFKRVQYKVSVDGKEEKIYDVMKEDTTEITFASEHIEKVMVGTEDYTGKPIPQGVFDINTNNVIKISTKAQRGLNEVDYKVKSVNFVTEATIYKPREFKGLQGTKLTVKPIRKNDHGAEDYTLNPYYRLSDNKEKQVVVEYGLEVPFNYVEGEVVRYKVLYLTKYYKDELDENGNFKWDLHENFEYDVEYKEDQIVKVLHETETFINQKGKPISISPKEFGENWKLINVDKEVDAVQKNEAENIVGNEIPGYEGFKKIKFVSDDVKITPEADTLYVYSYAQLVNTPEETVTVKLRETLGPVKEENVFENNVVELTYPRYDKDYTVELNIGKRHTCYSEARLTGKYSEIKGIKDVKFENGKISFVVMKKEHEGQTDLFPKFKAGMRSLGALFALDESNFEGIEINYDNWDGTDNCGDETSLVPKTVTVNKSTFDENGKPRVIGDKAVYKASTLKGTKIRLGVLDEQGNYVKDIIRCPKNNSYEYYPENEKTKKFHGVVNSDGETITQKDPLDNKEKLVGKDTDELIVNDDMIVHLIYKKHDPDVIPVASTKFKTNYYKVELPDELLSKFYTDNSGTSHRPVNELSAYYDKLEKDINEYYVERNINAVVESEELEKMIIDYFNTTMAVEDIGALEEGLKEIKVELEKIKVLEISGNALKKVNKILDEIDKGEISSVGGRPEEDVTKADVLNKVKEVLDNTLYKYLVDKGYKISLYKTNVTNVEKTEQLLNWYDKTLVPGKTSSTRKIPYNDTHEYEVTKKHDYAMVPVSISKQITPKQLQTKDFIKIEDYNKDFELSNEDKWENNEITKVMAGFEIKDEIPVIYVQRGYENYKLVEKDIEPPKPEETKKDLHIVYRFYDKDGNLLQENPPIIYKDLPAYMNRLGWKINDFRENFHYMDDGKGLKEGDIKYSDKLENNKIVILYLDYKGEGEIPPIKDEKYHYTVFYQEVDRSDLSKPPVNISSFKSYEKYPEGTKLDIVPLNLESQGYRLLDDNYNITNKYLPKEIVIKDDRVNTSANYYYYRYVNENDNHIYKVEYMDKNNKVLADNKMVYVPDKENIVEEVIEQAKSISNYKPRISSIKLLLDKIDAGDIHVLVDELKAQGYTVVIKDKLITISKGNVEAARLYIDSNKINTVRFIYDQDENKPEPPGPGDKVEPSVPEKVKPKDPKGVEHIDYVEGYPDGSVKPLNDITRAEVSAIIYRIMDESRRSKIYSMKYDYNDTSYKWSREYIASLTNGNIVEGYPDGSFRPNGSITRGEVAAMIARYNNVTKGKNKFQDVKGHWSEDVVGAVLENGWIQGYPDGSYRPDQPITRAELVTIINRMLDRGIKKEDIEKDKIIKFTDLKGDEWYYADMVEATNGHDFKKKVETNKVRENEHWTYIKYYNEHMYGRNLKKKTK